MPMTQADHDLLITHSGKIDALCRLIKSHISKIDNDCDARHGGISSTHKEMFGKIDTKTDIRIFMWIIGLLFTSQMIVCGIVGGLMLDGRQNTQSIEHLEQRWELYEKELLFRDPITIDPAGGTQSATGGSPKGAGHGDHRLYCIRGAENEDGAESSLRPG